MPSTLQPALEKHPFLKNMAPEIIALLTGCAKNRRFVPDEYVVRAGTDADSFFLVRTGRMVLTAPGAGQPMVVQTAGPGDLVGWSWIIAPYRYRFDVRATESTVAFEFDGKCLRTKCEAKPELGYELLKRVSSVLGQRLDDLQLRLLDVYRQPSGDSSWPPSGHSSRPPSGQSA